MRIVYLIMIRVILLSISIAETDRPMGPFEQYHHHYHQRLPRPIILEPVMKLKSERGPLDWLLNMVSEVIERPKKPPPATIGPINLPRMAGQVYIRQLEDYSPDASNHIVIKVVTADPLTGMNVPYDSDLHYHHSEDSAQRIPKLYSHDANKSPGRFRSAIQTGYQIPNAKKNYNGQPYYGVQNHHYSNLNRKPFRVSASNDFNRNYHFRNHQEHYDSSFIPSHSYRNTYYQKLKSNITPHRDSGLLSMTSPPSTYHSIPHRVPEDSSYSYNYKDQLYRNSTLETRPHNFHFANSNSASTTLIPYSDHALRVDDKDFSKRNNSTWINHHASLNSVPSTFMRYRQVVRNDRMVPNNRYQESFTPRDRTNCLAITRSQDFRNWNQVPMIKFELRDVRGLEIITPPNLNGWDQEMTFGGNKDYSGISNNSGINRDKVSIGTGDSTNHVRNKSAERTSDEQTGTQSASILQSRLSPYTEIDRTNRHQAGQNMSLESLRTHINHLERMDEKKNASTNNELAWTDEKVQDEAKTGNATSEAAPKVINFTESNRWRFQDGSKPTRIVKTIYRRKPISEISKSN